MPDSAKTKVVGKVPISAVVNLINYAEALKEYLEEQMPKSGTALQALNAVMGLLKELQAGKSIACTEFDRIMSESYGVFVRSGLVLEDPLPSSPKQELCIPDWCIRKLYDGISRLPR